MSMTLYSKDELKQLRAELPHEVPGSWLRLRHRQGARWIVFGNPAEPGPGTEIVIGRAGQIPPVDVEIDARTASSPVEGVPSRLLVLRTVGQPINHTGQTLSFLSVTSAVGKWRAWERRPTDQRWRPVPVSPKDEHTVHGHSGYPGTDILIIRHPGSRAEGYEESGFPVLWVSVGPLSWLEVIAPPPERPVQDTGTQEDYEITPLKTVRLAFLPSVRWEDTGYEARPLDSTMDAVAIAAYCQSIGQPHQWWPAYEKHYHGHQRRNDPRAHIKSQAISDLLDLACSRIPGNQAESKKLLTSVVPDLGQFFDPNHSFEGGQRSIEALAGALYRASVLNRPALVPVRDRLLDLGYSL
jgi:hypothetical protein